MFWTTHHGSPPPALGARRLLATVLLGLVFAGLAAGCGGGAGPGIGAGGADDGEGAGGGGGGGGSSSFDPAGMDALVRSQLAAARIPGCAALRIERGRIVWAGAYGLADVATGRPVVADSIFQLASVSKAVTAVALLQLFERGRFALDEAVDRYLPFAVRNPRQGGLTVTFRQLLTHTSGILDTWEVLERHYRWNEDSPIALGEFLRGYLVPGGAYYDAASWARTAPGTTYAYSNVGAALVGYLVEAIAGVPFDVWCQREIFDPLGMRDTTWSVSRVARDRVAWPYVTDGQGWTTEGLYGVPDYPDGQLMSTAPDLAVFLAAIMSRGEHPGGRILESATVDLLQQRHIPALDDTQGLLWYWDTIGARAVFGHEGGETGIATAVFFDPVTQVGAVVLLNGEVGDEADNPLASILTRLLAP